MPPHRNPAEPFYGPQSNLQTISGLSAASLTRTFQPCFQCPRLKMYMNSLTSWKRRASIRHRNHIVLQPSVLSTYCAERMIHRRRMKRGASGPAMPPLAEGAVRCCDNCATTDTPLWRPEKTLEMMLCNACSIWWRTKKTHRPKPSPETLAKRAAAAAAKASAAVINPKQCLAESSPESSAQPTKRLRRARTWGDEIEVYSDCEAPLPSTPFLYSTSSLSSC